MIRLSAEAEPQIFATSRRFGTILENVAIDAATRQLDLNDDSLTENTRGAYPISFIEHWVPSGQGSHPLNIVMLTADAFGVLPPIARLTPAAANYHFLSGYTAKWRAPKRESTSRRSRLVPALAHRSWSGTRTCTRSCWVKRSPGKVRRSGS